MNTETRNKATAKYHKKTYDRKVVLVRKTRTEMIEEYCKQHGKTFSGLVNELLEREIPGYKERR